MTAYGFHKKPIRDDRSFGQLCQEAREKKKVTLVDVELDTRIRANHLEAIESNRYDLLPAVYSKGFIRRYGEYLALPSDIISRQCELLEKPSKKQAFVPYALEKDGRWFITPKVVITVLVLGLILTVGGYIGYQMKQFTAPPPLSISKPGEESMSVTETVSVEGKTDSGALLFVDNLQANVNVDGTFSYPITLRPGLNRITVTAENRLKKQTARMISILYEPATPTEGGATPPEQAGGNTVSLR